jgi:hypothetical protein
MTLAFHHNRFDGGIVAPKIEALLHEPDHRQVEGVERLLPIEPQASDAPLPVGADPWTGGRHAWLAVHCLRLPTDAD